VVSAADDKSRGTVVLHAATAMNDITSDTGFVDIEVVIAIDHKSGEVIDGDIRYDLLERRLLRDGWDVVHELDEFTHDGSRWVQRVDDALACAVEACTGDAHDHAHSPTIGICGHTGATYETLLAVIHPPATDIEWGATIYLRDGRRIDGMLANVPMDSPDWEDDSLPVREEEGDPAIWWIPFGMIVHIQIG